MLEGCTCAPGACQVGVWLATSGESCLPPKHGAVLRVLWSELHTRTSLASMHMCVHHTHRPMPPQRVVIMGSGAFAAEAMEMAALQGAEHITMVSKVPDRRVP